MASYSLLGDVDSWTKRMAVQTPAWMRERKSSVFRIIGLSAAVVIGIMLFASIGFPSTPATPKQPSPAIAEHDHSLPIPPPPTPVCPEVNDKNWRFDSARDARNLGLSEQQCDVSGGSD